MSANRNRRITKEMAELENDKSSGVKVEHHPSAPDDLTHLQGSFMGPPDTPYEGGTYIIDIRIGPEYPFQPPEMKFTTKIWHPNVSSVTGLICLDTLKQAWSPVLTLRSALISVQGLLESPEPKDPQDHVVASQFLTNHDEYKYTARQWAIEHAGAPDLNLAEGSGGATADTLKRAAAARKRKDASSHLEQYHGYNKELIDRFVGMGFDVPTVVSAFEFVGIDRMDGQDYELEEEYMGDITARLFGEA
ncbi:hypothetical protein B0A49_00006 [Cryomyces minteri]|uniref:Ubiquitin-conjugating enzyme E2 1 n=1 Tax=Cryomyces minteri TaxID=331657 RepID=A0A4U0Y223_9PEZI|nr:hypothetical protein B0A49_00006 [Cryomyces minteri]